LSIRGGLMKINPVTRNTMSKMISNVRLNSVTDVSTVGKTEKIDTQNNAMSTTSGELMKEHFYYKLEKKEDNRERVWTWQEIKVNFLR